MNIPVNSRDVALQNTAIRVLGISTNYINLTCPTQQFKYGTDNVAQPSSTIVTATLVGALQGTVTFSTTGFSTVPTSTNNQLTINPDHITGDFATINASLVYQGETYLAVPISLSKIFNQLVVRVSTPISQVPAYSDGTGYTLPTADNFVELYNGVVPLITGVVYGPATQTKNGLTVEVSPATGKILVSQTNPNTWTSTVENFTVTATRNNIVYSTTYTVNKAKQGFGGQQLADVALYQWSTAQPPVPLGTSVYTWATKALSYTNEDNWRTTVSDNPGNVGIKLWKVTKGIIAASEATAPTYNFTWVSGSTVREINTESNELIKTQTVIVYKNDISAPAGPSGTATYNWANDAINTDPLGWSSTAPDTPAGFTLYQAAVDIVAAQSETSSTVDWTRASITPVRYSGGNGVASIIADLTNATHAIPTDSTGTTINFANSGSDLFVYEGATALTYDGIGTGTGKYKVTVTGLDVTPGAASAVTISGVTGVRFAILTGATFATNTTGKITYVVSGRRLTTEPGVTLGTPFTYTVEQTFTKTPGGVQGVAGVAYWLITSASVVQKNISNVYNPTAITVSGKQSAGAVASNYSGWFKIFLNNNTTAEYSSAQAEASTTYTITGTSTTKVRVNLYSDSEFTNLLDQETIPVVSDGDTGQTGASARRAYVVVTTVPSGTPASLEVTGDSLPTAGTWFANKTYSATAPTTALAEGESLYQSDGVYVSGGNTTWGYPYLSTLKVGNLQAISANTGSLTVTGDIKGSATNFTTGNGYVLTSDGRFRVGDPTGAQLKFDSAGLVISNSTGTNIFTVVSNAESAAVLAATNAGTAATNAGTAADAAAAAVAVAGNTTWLGDAAIKIVTGTELRRIDSTTANNNWNAHRYSAESYTNGAYITFIPAATAYYFMIGMDSNPTQNSSYDTIDYAWYCRGDGILEIYENGSGIGIQAGYNTYSSSTVLSIIYDGRYVKYYRDGVLIRTLDKGAGIKLYADSSFNNVGASAKSIRFGPVGTLGDKGDAATISIGTITTAAAGSAASVTNSGTTAAAVLNFTIPQGAKGADSTIAGPRGSLTGYGRQYAIYSAAWNDNLANRIINNMLTGEISTAELTTTTHLRIGDTVTITNGATATAAFTRYWTGSWTDPSVVINGNLIVTGTIGADKLAANSILVGHQIKNATGTFVIDFGASPYISISV